MACARRSLISNFAILNRRFHPSLSHILPDEKNSEKHPISNSRPLPDLYGRGTSLPGVCVREWSRPGLSFPLGFDQSLRRYSSSTGGSNEVTFMKDVGEVFTEKGTNVVDVLTEKSLEVTQAAGPAVGEVATAAASSAPPVAALQHVIDAIHSFTGLNWWGAIAVTTLLIRLCTVPIMIHQLKATTKLTILRPELEAMKEQMQNATDPHVMQENRRRMKELFKKHGVSPFTPLKGLFIQGPVFISFYLAISNMVEKVPSFKEGGAFWFTDLTAPDPFYALPILTGLSFLLTVELNMQAGMEGNPMASNMKTFSRMLAILTVPFTASFPKAIFCYWITSNLYSLVYGLVLKRPPVRKFLKLPEVAPETVVASQPSLPFGGFRQFSPTTSSFPSNTTQQSESPDGRTSSSSIISQRIRNLEKTVKSRRKSKKR